jgi:hypothetical protein
MFEEISSNGADDCFGPEMKKEFDLVHLTLSTELYACDLRELYRHFNINEYTDHDSFTDSVDFSDCDEFGDCDDFIEADGFLDFDDYRE